MLETQQTHPTDSDGSSEGNEVNAMVENSSDSSGNGADAKPQASELKIIEKATGRRFESIDEAEKYLKNLNGLVGDYSIAKQRERAELFDATVSTIAHDQGISEEDARKYIEDSVKPQRKQLIPKASQRKEQDVQISSRESELQSRLEEVERKTFLQETPEAKKYMDKVDKYAKAYGLPLQAAFEELYGPVIREMREQSQSEKVRMEKMNARVTSSSSSPPKPQDDKYARLMAEYKKTGDQNLFLQALKVKQGME